MKYLIFVFLGLSLNAFGDDCSTKALRGVSALARVNKFRLIDLKITGMETTEGDGTRLLLSARDLHDHPYSFTADVAQSEGPCVLLSVNVVDRP